MLNPDTQTAPPLKIWVWICITCLGIGVILFFRERYTRAWLDNSRRNYLEQGFQKSGSKPVVLILGTSLLESGVFSCDSIASNLAINGNIRPVVLKYWKRGAAMSSLVNQLIGLKNVQPALVVLEANMLFYRPPEMTVRARYMQTFLDLVSFKNARMQYAPDAVPVFTPITRAAMGEFRSGMVDSNEIRSFRNLAVQWQSKGTRILLINFPIEEQEEKKKWLRADTAAFNRNLRFLKEKISFTYQDDHLQLDETNFYDFAHLNLKGNKIFSICFCRSICVQLGKS
jgi:hypothetical protein